MKLPQKVFIRIMTKTNGRCFYCNAPAEVVDHFLSRKKHSELNLNTVDIFEDEIENLMPCCQKCNLLKRDNFAEDFFGNSYKIWSRYFRANDRIGVGCGREFFQKYCVY